MYKNKNGIIAFALAGFGLAAGLSLGHLTQAEGVVSDSINSSAAAFPDSDKNYTEIIITGKTMIIKAAEGYTPTIKSGTNKPLVILERDPKQVSSTEFNEVVIESDSI